MTSALFVAIGVVETLRQDRIDEFIAAMPALLSLLDKDAAVSVVEQPLVRYASTAVDLCRQMRRLTRGGRRLMLADAWDRLVKRRVRWWERLKLAVF